MSKGDVYFERRGGQHVGSRSNHLELTQQHYSIHPTRDSLEYTMLKSRMRFSDGRSVEAVQLNRAVKSKKGFALLLAFRTDTLELRRFDLRRLRDSEVLSLGECDTSAETPVVSLFVGHRSTGFPRITGAKIQTLVFDEFKLVFVLKTISLPASATGYVMNFSTLREADDTPREIQAVQQMRDGKTGTEIKARVQKLCDEFEYDLIRRSGFLETWLARGSRGEARFRELQERLGRDVSAGYNPLPSWVPPTY